MIWKIYFWFLLISLVGSVLSMIPHFLNFNPSDIEGVVEGVIYVLALNAYIWKGVKFPARVWATLFIAIVSIVTLQILSYAGVLPFAFLQTTAYEASLPLALASVVISIPALYVMYKMGFEKKS